MMQQPRELTDTELDEMHVSARVLLEFARDQQARHDDEVRELRRIIAEQQRVLREQHAMLREATGMDLHEHDRAPAAIH